MLQDHLRELERNLEITLKTSPTEHGVFIFKIDEEITITFHDIEEGSFITCQLCDVPNRNREDIYIMLSELNLLGEGGFGSVFGLTEDSKHLIMSHLIEYDVGYPQFYEIVEDFVNLAKITLDDIKSA